MESLCNSRSKDTFDVFKDPYFNGNMYELVQSLRNYTRTKTNAENTLLIMLASFKISRYI